MEVKLVSYSDINIQVGKLLPKQETKDTCAERRGAVTFAIELDVAVHSEARPDFHIGKIRAALARSLTTNIAP